MTPHVSGWGADDTVVATGDPAPVEPAAMWSVPLSREYGRIGATRVPFRTEPVTVVGDVSFEPGMVRVRTGDGTVARTLREYVTMTDAAPVGTPEPVPTQPRWKPGSARLGEPSPQSHPEQFTDNDLRAEFRYLARLNGRYGLHELRVAAQNKLIAELESRGGKLPTGYVTGERDPREAAVAARPAPTRGRPGGQLYWRGCSGCNTSLARYDGSSEYVWCSKCRVTHVETFEQWAASIRPGSRVFLQPSIAGRLRSRSQWLVTARDGDTLTVQLIGLPESSTTVHIGQAGQHDMTPRLA